MPSARTFCTASAKGTTSSRSWALGTRPFLGALADLEFIGLDDDPEDPVVVTGYKATSTRKSPPPRSRPTTS